MHLFFLCLAKGRRMERARAGPVVSRQAPVERSGVRHCYQLVTNGQRQPNF